MIEDIIKFQKIEELKKEFVKFFDAKQLYDNLAISALYIAIFEILKSTVIGNINNFISMEEVDSTIRTSLRNKQGMEDYFKLYSGRQDKEYQVGCHWLFDFGVINESEWDLLRKIKDQRNKIAHELPNLLLDPQQNVDISLLINAKDLIYKIEMWWANVNIQCDEYFDKVSIQDDEIISFKVLILEYIFNSFNKKEDDSNL